MKDVILAVDGGNSKTDAALCTSDGELLAAVRGPTTSHQAVGLEPDWTGWSGWWSLCGRLRPAPREPSGRGCCLAGMDLPSESATLPA